MDITSTPVQQTIFAEVRSLSFKLMSSLLVVRKVEKYQKLGNVILRKPSELDLFPFIENNVDEDEENSTHPLNSKVVKDKLQYGSNVTCYEFFKDMMFTGFGDGLICCWEIGTYNVEEFKPEFLPLLGHTNKVNQLKVSLEMNRLFSCSDDCTLRQWSLD